MYDNAIKRKLREIFLYNDGNGTDTIEQAARVCGVDYKTFHKYVDPNSATNIPTTRLRVLNIYMLTERRDTRIAEWLCGPSFAITPAEVDDLDGEVTDEILGIDEMQGDLLRAIRSGDKRSAEAAARKIVGLATRLKAEVINAQ